MASLDCLNIFIMLLVVISHLKASAAVLAMQRLDPLGHGHRGNRRIDRCGKLVSALAAQGRYPVTAATGVALLDSDVVSALAGRAAQRFSVQDITEATALALMEDMLTGKR